MKREKTRRIWQICCNYVFPLMLLLYPLRHIAWGLDMRDTGYNYANFRYMGLDHMDSMWLYSTYLANAVGHLLTFLPGGSTLLGLNLYTRLSISLLALAAYFFSTRKLQIPAGITFVAEMAAISLCWCPTAVLYNYLTYLLLFAGIYFLYAGLLKEKHAFLVIAGICLGTNVFVRFSNLPQAALIVVLWGYGLICRKKFTKVLQETGFCVLGYLAAVAVWLGYLSLRYGFGEYVEGILRLFSMTESASDYKASSMVVNMVLSYVEQLYWVSRVCVIMSGGYVAWLLLPKKWKRFKQLICIGLAVLAAWWLYTRNFCIMIFTEYVSMLRPATVFLLLTLVVCGVRIIQKRTSKEEKLIAMLITMQVLLTALGSNNRLYSSINNIFLAAPYVLWQMYLLLKSEKVFYPVKPFAVMFLSIFLVQSLGFGWTFMYQESVGAQNVSAKVENNAILKGISMNPERAEWLTGISEYVTTNGLTGRESILYGAIPSMSFYLDMPSAFNPWIDLQSYNIKVMKQDMEEVQAEILAGGDAPVIILESAYGDFLSGESADTNEIAQDEKFALLTEFIKENGYERTFENEKFALYEAQIK